MTLRFFALVLVGLEVSLSACVPPGSLALPLPDAEDRPTPLHFGLYVTPDPSNNPIDPPERFTGFHTALDFEVFEDEAEEEVVVFAICSGWIAFSGYVEGYGGVLVQRCRIKRENVTVLYGHIAFRDLLQEGSYLKKGQQFAILAPARSYESGGNRKHFHLGVHRGKRLEFRGYVQREEDLKDFIDPKTVLPL